MLIVTASTAGESQHTFASYHSVNLVAEEEASAMYASANISGGDAIPVLIDLVSSDLR